MRAWKTTLTFNSHEACLIRYEAEKLAKGDPWGTLTYDEQFALLQKAAGRRLTLVLKRMRSSGMKFRYIAVGEFHKSGVPHFHCIFHELGTPMRKRELEAAWPYGFSKFKLVPVGGEATAIRYATKYLAKDNASRIRASIRYGVGDKHGSEGQVAPRDAVALLQPSVVTVDAAKNRTIKSSLTSKNGTYEKCVGVAWSHLEEAWALPARGPPLCLPDWKSYHG